MNELKSYTEYAVSTPTADFVIGFDFNYGEDAVNVTVDDVPATTAGYTVVYLNETTIRLSPSVPSGVVRLQRETDIDQTDNAYRAGAKFIAQTMDENFEQLRHSQQEVRDGFVKLADDTYEIIDTLNEVGQSAQDAAAAAEVAAELANNAAAQVNDKVSYADFNNKPHNAMLARDAASAHPTSSILDGSGETQQQVNYNGGSKWHSRVGGYQLNERVVLTNGDIVKSTVGGNANDPNVNMAGWVNPSAVQESTNSTLQSRIDDLYSYIVYAEKYGATLNEAMDAINTEFIGSRVRVYVPSDFPVTNTVNLNIDCDLDLSTLQVNNDIDVIFNPAVDWSGSSTPCDVFCNKKSIRLGWDLKKNLGRISINKCRFIDVGDPVAQTSADWYCGFYIQNTGIEKLDLYEPTTLNSYVKPNGVLGDTTGSNRNIILEGTASAGATVSDINIYDMRAENLTLEEDSDAIAINLGASTVVGTRFNIDIHRGYIKNVQRRAIKIIGHNTGSTGIRIHGDIIAFGGGVSPHACIDISGTVTVEWNGSLSGGVWTQGLLVWNGAKLVGNFDYNMDMGKTNIINGTSVRSLVVTGSGTLVDINSLNATGGFELFRNELNNTIKIKYAAHTAYFQVATDVGDTEIGRLSVKFTDPDFSPTRAAYLLSIGAGKHRYGHVSVTSDVATPIANFARLLNSSDVEVNKFEGSGVFTSAPFLLTGASNTKIRKAKPTTSPYLVSCVNGGANLLLDQCKAGSTALIANGSASPLTNVVELNTQTF